MWRGGWKRHWREPTPCPIRCITTTRLHSNGQPPWICTATSSCATKLQATSACSRVAVDGGSGAAGLHAKGPNRRRSYLVTNTAPDYLRAPNLPASQMRRMEDHMVRDAGASGGRCRTSCDGPYAMCGFRAWTSVPTTELATPRSSRRGGMEVIWKLLVPAGALTGAPPRVQKLGWPQRRHQACANAAGARGESEKSPDGMKSDRYRCTDWLQR